MAYRYGFGDSFNRAFSQEENIQNTNKRFNKGLAFQNDQSLLQMQLAKDKMAFEAEQNKLKAENTLKNTEEVGQNAINYLKEQAQIKNDKNSLSNRLLQTQINQRANEDKAKNIKWWLMVALGRGINPSSLKFDNMGMPTNYGAFGENSSSNNVINTTTSNVEKSSNFPIFIAPGDVGSQKWYNDQTEKVNPSASLLERFKAMKTLTPLTTGYGGFNFKLGPEYSKTKQEAASSLTKVWTKSFVAGEQAANQIDKRLNTGIPINYLQKIQAIQALENIKNSLALQNSNLLKTMNDNSLSQFGGDTYKENIMKIINNARKRVSDVEAKVKMINAIQGKRILKGTPIKNIYINQTTKSTKKK